MKPIDETSNEYSSQSAGIQFAINSIKNGMGDYEESREDGSGIKTAMLPLVYFRFYLEKNQYPHPELLEYFGKVFEKILIGQDPKTALGLALPRGRRPLDNDAQLRHQRDSIGFSIYYRVHQGPHRVNLATAIREACKVHHLSPEALYNYYRRSKSEYEIGRALARKYEKNAK